MHLHLPFGFFLKIVMTWLGVNVQAVFLGHQGVDVHTVCLQNKLSGMTVEANGLSLLYGVSTTDNRSASVPLSEYR